MNWDSNLRLYGSNSSTLTDETKFIMFILLILLLCDKCQIIALPLIVICIVFTKGVRVQISVHALCFSKYIYVSRYMKNYNVAASKITEEEMFFILVLWKFENYKLGFSAS